MTWRGPLQLCASILAGAGFVTWKIAHNIDNLLIKNQNHASQFDLTINVREEKSNVDLAECVQERQTEKLNELVESCDNRVLVELPSPDSIENDLKALLLKLPLSGLDPCTIWFTQNAVLTGKSASQHQRPLFWSFSGESLSLARTLSSMPAEQVELYYLKALTRHSMDLALFSHAVRTLANLDRDFCKDESYEDGVYLLHPQGRHSSQIEADVIFVHGLRGGPFMTWRQQEEKTSSGKNGTECWPRSWLVRDIPNIRVLMVEYDTSLTHWVSQCPQQPET
ncbi:Protein SERAC1 [Acropora cervicornis]|uniref:Protein SERAC1 n=1 Tax=Acropora cervicornis TaxID=6130 RepID=A0AAD9R3J4_ACRCE|nr:Protein SERAC1 [Acropora cervicornis]